MALIVPLTIPEYQTLVDGQHTVMPAVEYPQAYARVAFARAFAAETYICVVWYADLAARMADMGTSLLLKEFTVPTSALAGDFYPACYAHLKTLPEFAGAVDHPVIDPAEPAPTLPEAQA